MHFLANLNLLLVEAITVIDLTVAVAFQNLYFVCVLSALIPLVGQQEEHIGVLVW